MIQKGKFFRPEITKVFNSEARILKSIMNVFEKFGGSKFLVLLNFFLNFLQGRGLMEVLAFLYMFSTASIFFRCTASNGWQ